jgi:hypothetical protein
MNTCNPKSYLILILCGIFICHHHLSNNTCNAFSLSSFQTLIPKVQEKQPSEDSFDIFVKMRTGLGKGNGSSDVVFWTGEGELYESPNGKMVARLDGYEVSRAIYLNNDKGQEHVRIFSRKIFWFRDKHTNEILTEYNGLPVLPIKYDWQVFDLKRGDMNPKDPFLVSIIPEVVRSPRAPPLLPITPRKAGSSDQLWFQVPLFIDLELPGGRGRYQAWEFYDYSIDTTFPTNRPPSLAWTRNGSNPPFVEDGHGVMHFHGYRVDSFEELPESLQSLVGDENNGYSLFRTPPLNMDEVDKLLNAQKNKT